MEEEKIEQPVEQAETSEAPKAEEKKAETTEQPTEETPKAEEAAPVDG